MIPEWLKILIPSLVGFTTAIVAAYLSARWAVRRGFQERWWERKERAYAEIVGALYDLIRYSELAAEESLSGREVASPKRTEFQERYSEAYWNIRRATDIGAFVISEEAAAILTELRKKPQIDWDKNPPWEIYEEDTRRYREALKQIIQCAKKDLRVRG